MAYFQTYNVRTLRHARLFRVAADARGGWTAILRNGAHTPIARATHVGKRWDVFYSLVNGDEIEWSSSPSPRDALIKLAGAARKACELGWTRLLLGELEAVLGRRPIESHLKAPNCVPVGAATALILVSTLAAEFGATDSDALAFLTSLNCGTVKAPNGLLYFSSWAFELCTLTKTLKTDLVTAARLLAKGQTVYRAARKQGTLDRLRSLAETLRRP